MREEPGIRQILLITDGCSNVGTDPVYVAQCARARGMTTSVIGILDEGSLGEQGRREAQNIAEAGGGICRLVQAHDLSQTMQMVTRQTMQLTLHHVVNAELRQLVGETSDGLPPETRTKVARFVETMTDEIELTIALVLDASASMQSKMAAVRESVRDLEFGLSARRGAYELIVVTYPGARGEAVDLVRQRDFAGGLADYIGSLRPSGNTPTGPALEAAMSELLRDRRMDALNDGRSGDVRNHVV
ncbi:vWA domain-containing protein [Ferroacidibacillus organovorans]|uniref:VWFA domain-containing protein n=1 Tax=Ferroacidibacillus organovorans TaxID=1765683 RepID=A0A1V4EQ01_9BACL|nr:vWA domain-containing protein [Ferroacidibacillus organovorans]OAG94925.1 hypothetical protein AYW79_02725 [Ferroacidibacillus organovorans]OPG14996.1 hypothetical protein B2M26_14280 [Ferroacidibacillus organovorans]